MSNIESTVQIDVALQHDQSAVGAVIPMSITYTNLSDETLYFDDPAKTWEVQLMIRNSDGNEERVPFGRIFYSVSDGIERRTVEEAEQIVLAPGKNYTFQVDIGSRWPELFMPGAYTLQIIDESDDEGPVFSSVAHIRMVFTEDSFPNLARMAVDDRYSRESRAFAVYGIKYFKPDFEINLDDEVTPDWKAVNQGKVSELLEWWRSARLSSNIQEKIDSLNSK